MKRAVIIAKGEVQRVEYRDTVEKIARKLNLTGFVENLKPYDVRIVAEGGQDALDLFITHIRIGEHPITPISVEDLDVRFEAATDEFEYFEIERGGWQDELGERLDVAGALLYRSVELGEKSVVIGEKMLEKQDVMIDKQGEHTQVITEFRDQTLQGFVTPDTKYGRISDNMGRLIDGMQNDRRRRVNRWRS
ncbi:MAG: Acylphosphatase [Candidatus Methanogasteraceae archaeon]|nr:MAG: Acylphosphatase [ANME-2 cluster archaeon]